MSVLEGEETKRKTGTRAKKIILVATIMVIIFALLPILPQAQATTYTYIVTLDSQSYDGYIQRTIASLYWSARNATTGDGSPSDTDSTATIGQQLSAGYYTVYRGYLYFDTSLVPSEATIDNATLSVKVATTLPTADFNLSIQNGQPTYPHTPLEIGDYYYDRYSGDGGNVSTSTMSTNTYVNVSLTSTALDWINVESTTKLCLRSDADINYTAPTTVDTLAIYMAEQGLSDSPKLYIGYSLSYEYSVNLHGPYNEDGTRDYTGINCTFTRPNQESVTVELNGTESLTAQTDTRLVITSDIGSNYTRVYYLRYDQWYEDIYIFYPDDIYTTYYITFVDIVGVSNGYLESILNINGTDRIIERQRVDVLNEIPFMLSWGTSYKFRLVCDEGTYIWQSVIAGSDTTFTLSVTNLAFPTETISIGDITLSATRTEDISIQALYEDDAELTEWVYISFTEREETTPAYYTNNTGNTHDITWSDALPNKSYMVYFEIIHEEQGTLTYSIVVPTIYDEDNPWDFSWMGDWGAIDSTQLVAMGIILAVFGGFSIGSVGAGIISMLVTAGYLIYIGWLDITWGFFTIVGCIAVLVIISIKKKESS